MLLAKCTNLLWFRTGRLSRKIREWVRGCVGGWQNDDLDRPRNSSSTLGTHTNGIIISQACFFWLLYSSAGAVSFNGRVSSVILLKYYNFALLRYVECYIPFLKISEWTIKPTEWSAESQSLWMPKREVRLIVASIWTFLRNWGFHGGRYGWCHLLR